MALQQQLTRRNNAQREVPQYRHATVVPQPWVDQMLNPFGWRVGHWAMFGVMLTLAADIIAMLYLFNFFGISRQFELQMWLIIAGIVGFCSITAALYAIFYRSGRGTGIVALILGLGPLPVNSTAPTAEFVRTDSNAVSSSSTVCGRNALRTSGRSIAIRAIRPVVSRW